MTSCSTQYLKEVYFGDSRLIPHHGANCPDGLASEMYITVCCFTKSIDMVPRTLAFLLNNLVILVLDMRDTWQQ